MDVTTKTTGSFLSAAEFMQLVTELENSISSTGEVLSAISLVQIGETFAHYGGGGAVWMANSGTDDYLLDPPGSQYYPAAMFTGYTVRFRAFNANTGTVVPRARVGSNGLVNIIREDGTAVAAGEIGTTRDTVLRYDASVAKWRLVNGTSHPRGGLYPPGYLHGFALSALTNTAYTIERGVCLSFAGTMNMVFTGTWTKNSNAVWAAGSAAGGRPSGLTYGAGGTWLRVFAIGNPLTGSVDFGHDTSATATNLLADATVAAAGFTEYRQIGWVHDNAAHTSSALGLQFCNNEDADYVWLADFFGIDNTGNAITSTRGYVSFVANGSCPPIDCTANIAVHINLSSTGGVGEPTVGSTIRGLFSDGAAVYIPAAGSPHQISFEVESGGIGGGGVNDSEGRWAFQVGVTGGQVMVDWNTSYTAGIEYDMYCMGYRHDRGRHG
jgi:hypothetical protein